MEDEKTMNVTSENIVRIAGSFDIGWPTKRSGRSYDSLLGIACIISWLTGKILAGVILRRKCQMCDLGHPKDDHDCMLNFEGSAKAMEPQAAALLVNNAIFKECNVQLDIFIGDNDSSAICAARNAVDYEVIKHDDINHTSKSVTSVLYKIIKNHKELNSNSIKYLQKCFNYCVTQNKGDKIKMAATVRNITSHTFNNDTNCGDWCGYKQNPES